MLQFVLGTAGTGKSTYLINKLKEIMLKGEKAILLVPEQYSFVSEKRLYKELGPKSSLQIEVLSFTRLCNNIFRKFGGLAGIPITDTSRYLLMSIAISELVDALKTYNKSAANPSFLDNLIQVCSEFKTAGITPEGLEKYTRDLSDSRLKDKLEDLSLVYTTYQSLIDTGYLDSEDDLTRAIGVLENNNFFKEYNVFIDGFTTFMAGEFELLNYIVLQSKSVTIALTTDGLTNIENETGLFAPVKQAAEKLKKIAKTNCIDFLEPVILTNPIRYKNNELTKLSKEFLQFGGDKEGNSTEFIRLYEANDSYDEILNVVATICELVRTQNIKYNEIAVITRDTDLYNVNIELLFSRYNIPYFTDKKLCIENTPIIFGILSALSAIQSNFNGEDILFLSKSPIMGLDIEEVSAIENYCYSWHIRGLLWQNDFINNPRGMVDTFTHIDSSLLKDLNNTRSKIIAPLNNLKATIEKGGGKNFSVGIFNFLEEINCTENLKKYSELMDSFEREQFINLNAQLWNNLMDILDIFGEVLKDINISKNRMIELFRLAVASSEIGVIPQTLDQVLVGGADRIRPEQLKVVFAIGVNEGSFPKPISNKGVFSQAERKLLIDSGIEIGGASVYNTLMEKFYGYFAFTLPSERLYVSYSKTDLKGQKKLPSIFITYLEELFSNCKKHNLNQEDLVQNESSGLVLLSENYREDNIIRATLYDYFKNTNPDLLNRMDKSAWKPIHVLTKSKYIKELFGNNMRLSPSRVERFYRCPFSYFAQDGLKLKKRQKVEFSPLESGSVIHYVLQFMMQKYGGKGLSELTFKQLEEEVSKIILEYLKTRIEDENNLPTRLKFLFERLCSTIARLLEHLGKEFLQSLYVPVAFELPIGEKEKTKPLNLVTADGINVTVEGVIDRVDIMEKNGEKFVRVVDYKSGKKTFKLQDILYGLNLQMLLYLFTIQEHGSEELEGAIPAGVLYMPVRESYSSIERSTSEQEASDLLKKQWSMNGILLNDEETLRGMEDDLSGVYIPAKLKKNGEFDSRSSLATNEELGRLSREIKEKIRGMAHALSKGEIESFPINDVDYPTCSYCDYRDVCGYEEGDPVRTIENMNIQEVFDILKEKEDENVG